MEKTTLKIPIILLKEKAKQIFGEDLVKDAYANVDQYGDKDHLSEEECAKFIYESINESSSKNSLNLSSTTSNFPGWIHYDIAIEFINGRTVYFITSEWLTISNSR